MQNNGNPSYSAVGEQDTSMLELLTNVSPTTDYYDSATLHDAHDAGKPQCDSPCAIKGWPGNPQIMKRPWWSRATSLVDFHIALVPLLFTGRFLKIIIRLF